MTDKPHLEPRAAKAPATAHIIFRQAADGYAEVIIDVTGAFVFRDKLKGHDFQFVRDRSENMEAAVSLDRHGNRKKSAAWRRIIVAVPPEVPANDAVIGVGKALDSLQALLNGVLEGSRVKGAKASAMKIAEHWKHAEGVSLLSQRLSTLDTPWQPGPVAGETIIRRPAFAA